MSIPFVIFHPRPPFHVALPGRTDSVDPGRTISGDRDFPVTLLGEQGKVTWIELTESLVVSGFYHPVLPFNQYRWQCQALLEVVAGQTGLPFYDERLPAHRW